LREGILPVIKPFDQGFGKFIGILGIQRLKTGQDQTGRK